VNLEGPLLIDPFWNGFCVGVGVTLLVYWIVRTIWRKG
jgi:hypothetical protein